MKLYLLWWDNGESYADHESTLVAVCITPEERQRIKESCKDAHHWPFGGCPTGDFYEETVEAGTLLYPAPTLI